MALPATRNEPSSQTLQHSPPVQRWEPFRQLEQMHEQMERLMDDVWPPLAPGNGGTWVPLADIEETDDAWIVEAELPSVDRKDVNVELRDSELVISGEVTEKERKGVMRRRTRRMGRFEYRVDLPGQPDTEHVEAKLHDGVLTVRVPKAEGSQRRRIDVKAT
ncbi:MAG: Hsp20/alpha crystallin family protein [Solirubrobacteraceae bacterium]